MASFGTKKLASRLLKYIVIYVLGIGQYYVQKY